MDVYFSSTKEVISFCEQLFHYNKKIELHWKTHEDWGNHLKIDYQLTENELVDSIAKSMVDVLVDHRLSNMIREIIEEYYYYTSDDEIEKIMDLAHWLFSGEDDESVQVRKQKDDPLQLLYSLIVADVKSSTTVHFDSVVKFRLKVFKDHMVHLVGLAIDEYKREEDHQEFVNMLREYIAKKEPIYNVVHIVQGNTFSFFKSDGKRFSRMELKMLMQREPLYIVGLDEEELNLAPLVAMAPKKIKIYGDHPSEPKTLTVINVFEERVDFEPYHKFPFHFYLKNQ
ncbi:putative sporulation protein YtxC [Ornithinibacillus sp. BX22]|uniref:Sporulation protein YtxC n=2 Tax=Ornithinibacillus TaxID=484508 RepID=A0A923L6V6_9BACI|nr:MULTISPECIES: putative sporulation protein YtxC [Ornithinibacillus]MBC5637496.1 putative sporulation protein YtxC [Ornithinibacillus hominis]MBS3682064.1 putative sporulation protein YtxC [Ornithinibacillus massiliensis]